MFFDEIESTESCLVTSINLGQLQEFDKEVQLVDCRSVDSCVSSNSASTNDRRQADDGETATSGASGICQAC